MWDAIAGAVVGGIAETLTSGSTGSSQTQVIQQQQPNYQGFMIAPGNPKVATSPKSTPAPVTGGSDAVQAWMKLLTSYKAK